MCKELQLPISSPLVQEMTSFELEFYEFSMLCDDPKALQRYENTYYDPEYDAWEKEFDKEQAEQAQQAQSSVELPDPDTVEWSGKTQQSSTPSVLDTEEYETYDAEGINEDDWEKEE